MENDTKQPLIGVKGLYKKYGTKEVLEDINLEIFPGTCYGLLGNNGAGKSTLIHAILDLIPITSGAVSIIGMHYPAQTIAIRSQMGVMPEQEIIQEELTGMEQLQLACMLYGIPRKERGTRILSLFNYFFDDPEDLKKTCASYSSGMRKKLGIIIALLHKPQILVLDEPFSGLDPAASLMLIEFLKTYMNTRRSLLISSHNLNYVEQLATHVGVIHEKHLIFNGRLSEFLERGSGVIDRTLFDLLKPTPKSQESVQWLMN